MSAGGIRAAVITTDEEFRSALKEGRERGLRIALSLDRGFAEIRDAEIKEIRLCAPQVVILDLDDDPELGCRLAGHLVDQLPDARVMVAGTDVPQSVLMTAIQAGVSECVAKPLTEDDLTGALERLERKLGSSAEADEKGRILACLGAKGGVGTTTMATNLAIQIRRLTGRPTLLVDLDLQLGEVALFLGLEPEFSVVDIVRNLHRLDEGLLQTFLTGHSSGVDLIAAPLRSGEEGGVRPDDVRRLLRFVRKMYAYVVVDASNAPTPSARAGLEDADEVFVVSQVDVPSVRNIQRFRHLLEGGNRIKPFRLVVNRFESDGEIALSDVEETLGVEVYWTLSNDYDTVVYSINTGKPFALNVPCAPAKEVEGLASKITGVELDRPEKQGWLARILGRDPVRRAPETPVEDEKAVASEPDAVPRDDTAVASGGS